MKFAGMRGRLKFGLLFFAAFLAFTQPRPAHAQLGSCPPGGCSSLLEQLGIDSATIAHFGAELTHWAAEALQWIANNLILSSGFTGVTNAIETAFHGTEKLTQATVDAGKLTAETAIVAARQADAVLPKNTEACATMALHEVSTRTAGAATAFGGSMARQDLARDTGPNANGQAPAAASEMLKDLCTLGFLSTNANDPLGKMAQGMGCTSNPNYVNAFQDPSRLIDKLQYPVPANGHVKVSPSNHVLFAGSTGTELDFVAAYKFCEYIVPGAPNYHNTLVTLAGITAANDNNRYNIMRSLVVKTCRKAIANRTACPQNSADSIKDVGGSETCFDLQKQRCDYLTKPLPEGLGLTMSHDPEMGAALANCQSQGISDFMSDKIYAHRCDDQNYLLTAGSNSGKAEGLKQLRRECDEDIRDFESKLALEEDRVSRMVPIVGSLKNMGVDTNALDQPAPK